MRGISPQGIPPPQTAPGVQMTYAELLEEYPELTDEVLGLTSVHDVGQPDRKSKAFEKQFPSQRPGRG
jgi:hypothetical protein